MQSESVIPTNREGFAIKATARIWRVAPSKQNKGFANITIKLNIYFYFLFLLLLVCPRHRRELAFILRITNANNMKCGLQNRTGCNIVLKFFNDQLVTIHLKKWDILAPKI